MYSFTSLFHVAQHVLDIVYKLNTTIASLSHLIGQLNSSLFPARPTSVAPPLPAGTAILSPNYSSGVSDDQELQDLLSSLSDDASGTMPPTPLTEVIPPAASQFSIQQPILLL